MSRTKVAANFCLGVEMEVEKVYVAAGSDLQDGFATLEWALKKWSSNSISIVIIHASSSISKDFVYTPCELQLVWY